MQFLIGNGKVFLQQNIQSFDIACFGGLPPWQYSQLQLVFEK